MSKTPDNTNKRVPSNKQMFRNERQLSNFSLEWREFLCGWSAAFFNIGLTYPIHKMIFRQMLHGVPFSSAFAQLRHEGIGYLYRGILPPLAQKTISLSIMFGVYDGSRKALTKSMNMGEYSAKCCAGLIAGSLEAGLLPFERVQTLLADQKYHTRFRNMPDCFKYVYAHHGAKELFRGMVPVLFRNGPSNSMFFLMREEAAAKLPKHKSSTLQSLQEFASGAIIGASLSALYYPFNVIKVSMQSEMGHAYEGMLTAAQRIYWERGFSIKRFYRGCGFNALRASVSWGVTNTAYENIKTFIYKI
ncbi:mitochondrial nicotinamide adenine dinucleotide transporter SLC25A51 [Hermetia illucens]|uniref:mitochondrial nicotinamide adenine dinucleotide transporter SLC25A51 n=1 Tax=Hermetia illucens TaxID=343691 RepID=UPI0018CC0F7B|nr:mitochondrial nicotinamide adenine dinucleotide transporter SLC25A51 [Hermetia illucens]XP_037924300.1 mitochondrial nicotinamide adenine dinucleotide transporter SLC25A51 [Hermetia illucens]XP_037924301.1 mitochondrial nicotinamide adenine dinucleotide transporter SLC25A51 [Hermetia illucens]